MILRTVVQVRRIFLILVGFTLLLLGIMMIFTPGPGTPVILMGLGLLAAEFVWARRIVDRIKRLAQTNSAASKPKPIKITGVPGPGVKIIIIPRRNRSHPLRYSLEL